MKQIKNHVSKPIFFFIFVRRLNKHSVYTQALKGHKIIIYKFTQCWKIWFDFKMFLKKLKWRDSRDKAFGFHHLNTDYQAGLHWIWVIQVGNKRVFLKTDQSLPKSEGNGSASSPGKSLDVSSF